MNPFEDDNYSMPVTHVLSTFIREYDIAKANINILLQKGLISQEKYIELYNAPKQVRERTVGLMQRNDKKLSESLMKGFGEARKLFFEANNIKEHEILEVRKDAIFLLGKVASQTKFGNIEFKFKNQYTSFYNFPTGVSGSLSIYFYGCGNIEKICIKGMGERELSLHKDYMLDLLSCVFASAQQDSALEVANLIKNISKDYISGELGINYYREFNNRSWFRTYITVDGGRAYLPEASSVSIRDIDPCYNYSLLQFLYKIFVNKYFVAINKR